MFNYGKRIKEIRIKNNISAYRLAKDLNVAQPTISKIETGNALLSLQLLEKICEYLSISLSEFFYDDTKVLKSTTYSDLPLEDIINLYIHLYPENSSLVLNQNKALNQQQDILKKSQETLKEQKENYELQKELFKNTLISHLHNKKDLD